MTATPDDAPDDSSPAEAIFADWTLALESGEALAFEDLLVAHPSQAESLKRLHDDWELFAPILGRAVPGSIGSNSLSVDPLSGHADEDIADASNELVDRLGIHTPDAIRYRFRAVLGRGGGGVVLKVWDRKLSRPLAMKVVLGRGEARPSGDTPRVDAGRLTRFVDEARIASQLDHPGIVPVHELGADETGRAFFTMKLVKGTDLSIVFQNVKTGKDGWNQTRAIGVLLRACEAMAYAHDKGVIHRDLKPANIMVGRYGEVYVMDWGLARVVGERDRRDLRIRPLPNSTGSMIDSVRSAERDASPNSPLVTMDGAAVGTPAYMSPEQARSQAEVVGPRSDVYALGVILYELIAGEVPFVPRGTNVSPHALLLRVLSGPPESLAELAPAAPASLVAICERAMARDIDRRYASTRELAEDLRAYLENRVVSAYETGTWAETRKWVQRNKPLAAALAGVLLALIAGTLVSTAKTREADAARREVVAKNADLVGANATIQTTNTELIAAKGVADRNAERALQQERMAMQKANDVLSLSTIQELKDLVTRADALWPALPDKIEAYDRWVADAKVLIDGRTADLARGITFHPGLKDHEAKLVEIRARARARFTAGDRPRAQEPTTWEFDDPSDRWWHAQLSELVTDLKAFSAADTGLFSAGITEAHGWGMLKRAEFARSIEQLSVSGTGPKHRWDEAITAIEKSEMYGGLRITPQIGLLPIGMDPNSRLWEFAHLQTGDPAERGADGKLVMYEATGLVLVLIPGGKFKMGSQATDVTGPNYDPQANADEPPVEELTLSPYFLSKYEMTQGQWLRFAGQNPSLYGPGKKVGDKSCSASDPVEQVSWRDCAETMQRLGLELPTEAQWEHGARGGTASVWWTGEDKSTLVGAANLADGYCMKHGGPTGWSYEEWLDDGWTVHAPVGSYRANSFGLHEVIGNVWEWCRDGYGPYTLPVNPNDCERQIVGARNRVLRGGGFGGAASNARSATRDNRPPEVRSADVGLRPGRVVEP